VQLFYGGTALFDANTCEVTGWSTIVRASGTGRPVRVLNRIGVKGYITGDGQSDLTTKENALRAILLAPYKWMDFRQDSGTSSGLTLVSSTSVTGVVVVEGPKFSEAMNAEYVTRRTVEFTAEAEYILAGASGAVISFTETVSIMGTGGPVTRLRIPVNNFKPVRQQISYFSAVKASQRGHAVGHTDYPIVPDPIWPVPILNQDQIKIDRGNPRRVGPGLGLIEYPISWNFEYSSSEPLVGLPGIPPL